MREALPSFLRPVATFGYYTGWRATKILNPQWRQVNLDAAEVHLDPGTTKNKEGRVIYLDGELLETMKAQRASVLSLQRERGEIIPLVFINPETADRIRNFRKSWADACKQTGLSGRLFHDFRRTAVRNMVRAGVPEVVAMRISGHKTQSIFDRYNTVSEQDLREAARRISTLLDPERQEPPEPPTHRATDPAQRNALPQESCNEGASLRGDPLIFWIKDQGAATPFTARVVFPRLDMAVSLVPPCSPLGTCFSRHHPALFSLPSPPCLLWAQSSLNFPSALLG